MSIPPSLAVEVCAALEHLSLDSGAADAILSETCGVSALVHLLDPSERGRGQGSIRWSGAIHAARTLQNLLTDEARRNGMLEPSPRTLNKLYKEGKAPGVRSTGGEGTAASGVEGGAAVERSWKEMHLEQLALVLPKARAVFDSADVDRSGDLSRAELVAKLKSDGEIEGLLAMKDVGGEGSAGAKALSKVLSQLDTDRDDGVASAGSVRVTWEEFEAAVKKAMPAPSASDAAAQRLEVRRKESEEGRRAASPRYAKACSY